MVLEMHCLKINKIKILGAAHWLQTPMHNLQVKSLNKWVKCMETKIQVPKVLAILLKQLLQMAWIKDLEDYKLKMPNSFNNQLKIWW